MLYALRAYDLTHTTHTNHEAQCVLCFSPIDSPLPVVHRRAVVYQSASGVPECGDFPLQFRSVPTRPMHFNKPYCQRPSLYCTSMLQYVLHVRACKRDSGHGVLGGPSGYCAVRDMHSSAQHSAEGAQRSSPLPYIKHLDDVLSCAVKRSELRRPCNRGGTAMYEFYILHLALRPRQCDSP